MRKILVLCLFLLNSCYRLPAKEEVMYRGRLENALVETFPKKMVVVVHPFENLSPADTNRAYLEDAIPDHIEAMLESLRTSLAYVPFDGMPFYVSSELSNLFQTINVAEDNSIEIITNNGVITTNELHLDEVITNDYGVIITNNSTANTNTNSADSYFSYLTNYLLVVPTQETQYNVITTTNTNYYEIETNVEFMNAVPQTNIVSNQFLITTTNGFDTNILIVNKNILTPTNMLLLLYEEFPELTNYLSFLPIEVRRATSNDTIQYQDYKLRIENPREWERLQAQRKKEEATNNTTGDDTSLQDPTKNTVDEYPKENFEYVYHIGGNYRTRNAESIFTSAAANIRMHVLPVYSTGDEWWLQRHGQHPPLLSDILELEASLDPDDVESYKALFLRTPFTKPPVSARLRDDFEDYSTNFRDTKPATPENPLPKQNKPFNLVVDVEEKDIPVAMKEWLKYFHSLIVNRPYTTLIVDTDPEDTLIYLNGVYIGNTPLVYPVAPIGEQRVAFIREGFNREEIFTEILPNQTNSISYKLQSLNTTGVVRVTSSLPDAEVYINSLYKGQTPVVVSNLALNEKYRIEILNPRADLKSNRNSVYRNIKLTEDKPSIDIDARFKDFETNYRTPAQKNLLIATYVSWFATAALLGGSVYSQYRYHEATDLVYQMGTPSTDAEIAQYNKYYNDMISYNVATQATLYSAIAAAILSTGLMGWYFYSKEVYLGMDVDPVKNEWYAKFKLEF